MLPAQALEISLKRFEGTWTLSSGDRKHLWECLELQFHFSEEKHLGSKQTLDILCMLSPLKNDLSNEWGLEHD